MENLLQAADALAVKMEALSGRMKERIKQVEGDNDMMAIKDGFYSEAHHKRKMAIQHVEPPLPTLWKRLSTKAKVSIVFLAVVMLFVFFGAIFAKTSSDVEKLCNLPDSAFIQGEL